MLKSTVMWRMSMSVTYAIGFLWKVCLDMSHTWFLTLNLRKHAFNHSGKNVFGHLKQQHVHFFADIQLLNEERCFNRVKNFISEEWSNMLNVVESMLIYFQAIICAFITQNHNIIQNIEKIMRERIFLLSMIFRNFGYSNMGLGRIVQMFLKGECVQVTGLILIKGDIFFIT